MLSKMVFSESSTTTVTISSTSASGTGCPGDASYNGDGWCDDPLNTAECHFDSGDCCGDNVQTDYCVDCLCLETELSTTQSTTVTTTSITTATKSTTITTTSWTISSNGYDGK